MSIFRWIIAILVIAGIGFLTLGGLKPRPKPPTEVETTKVGRASITRTVSGAGKLEPAHKINVSSQITGNLIDLKVDIGSQVKKGDYLGQIDTALYTTQVRGQKAQLSASSAEVQRARTGVLRAQQDLDRLNKLAEKNAVGQQEVDQAITTLRSAEAELAAAQGRMQQTSASLAQANQSLEWATLRAPADGTVLAVNHRVGERIRGSDFSEDTILVIGSVAQMEVKIEVGEHDIVWIRDHQEANVEIDALPDQHFPGHVIDFGRDAIIKNAGTDNEVTTFYVWVGLDNAPPEALSGMSARVDVYTETKDNVIAAPIQAVTVRPPDMGGGGGDSKGGATAQAEPKGDKKDDDKKPPGDKPASDAAKPDAKADGKPAGPRGVPKLDKVVFVLDNGVVHRRKVTTGLSSEDMVEITDGLKEGEVIVSGPYRVLARQLEDGDKVSTPAEGGGGPGKGGGRRGGRGQ